MVAPLPSEDTRLDVSPSLRTLGEHLVYPRQALPPRIIAALPELPAILDAIRERAVVSEVERILPVASIRRLKEAGLGALRLPKSVQGHGAGLVELIETVIALASADSNVAQALRGHFAFVETRLAEPQSPRRDFWLSEVAAGALVGNAHSEQGPGTWSNPTVELRARDAETAVLKGRKYYSTGTVFADWVSVTAQNGDDVVNVIVRTDTPGVTVLDDWDGFGQRLTGTGSTVFDDAVVERRHVFAPTHRSARPQPRGFYQLYLLAVAAGVGAAALDDVLGYVRGRVGKDGTAAEQEGQDRVATQRTVGRVAARVFAARESVLAAAAALERLLKAHHEGIAVAEDYAAAEATVHLAQVVVIPLILDATEELFEAGGASALTTRLALDRHWRNARAVSSHNPLHRKEQGLGSYLLEQEVRVQG